MSNRSIACLFIFWIPRVNERNCIQLLSGNRVVIFCECKCIHFHFFFVHLIQPPVCIFDVYLEGHDNPIVVRYSHAEASNSLAVFHLHFNKTFLWVRITINRTKQHYRLSCAKWKYKNMQMCFSKGCDWLVSNIFKHFATKGFNFLRLYSLGESKPL